MLVVPLGQHIEEREELLLQRERSQKLREKRLWIMEEWQRKSVMDQAQHSFSVPLNHLRGRRWRKVDGGKEILICF